MEKTNNSILVSLKNIFWPIENNELKKFLPMAAMMFLILFNYSMLRSIKDGFIVTHVGAEALGFLKLYVVLPFAIIAMVIYVKLCNMMTSQNVFYSVSSFFAAYLTLFTFVLYPFADALHPNPELIASLAEQFPNFKWFIKIAGKWTFGSFYVMAELWGSMMLSLLFWQFANQITKTAEAKRFYSMFGMIGNLGLILTGFILGQSLSEEGGATKTAAKNVAGELIAQKETLGFEFVIGVTIFSVILLMLIYRWINVNILTDKKFYDPDAGGAPKKKKSKMSLGESFKLIFSSKYLGMIALLVISYGISINLVEGVWKAKAKLLYPTPEAFTVFLGQFQMFQGIGAIVFMIIGSNILRLVSWSTAALLTPLMILITGMAFFTFIVFDNQIAMYMSGILVSTPVAMAVAIGTVQNVLSKSTKYSLFDSTKEMAYIPLDDELKSKGKAAVEVVGGRLGKSGGAAIQSTLFILFPSMSFAEATPILGVFFLVILFSWTFAVRALAKEYNQLVKE